jgi:hypothetical protein
MKISYVFALDLTEKFLLTLKFLKNSEIKLYHS